ncbi:MAG: hypothetical protein ABIJ42_04595 [Acidobacteriota bacterium]
MEALSALFQDSIVCDSAWISSSFSVMKNVCGFTIRAATETKDKTYGNAVSCASKKTGTGGAE